MSLAEVRFTCGRYYLSIAGIAMAMEGDPCRAMLPESVCDPIPAQELDTATIGDKRAKDLPIDVVRFFRGDNWTQTMMEYVAEVINTS